MDYTQNYEAFLRERERLRNEGKDTTPLIKELTAQVERLAPEEASKFIKDMIEIDKKYTAAILKQMEEIENKI